MLIMLERKLEKTEKKNKFRSMDARVETKTDFNLATDRNAAKFETLTGV